MTAILSLSIGVGLAIGLLFTELFGIAAGGMVVPGYMALYLSKPLDILVTIGAALFAFGLVKLVSPFVILYGRRRTALMILSGYVIGILLRYVVPGISLPLGEEFQVIGFIIPGLLAIWMDRQGVWETVATLLTVSVIIRLILVIILGEDIII